jgi:hypothetical protein
MPFAFFGALTGSGQNKFWRERGGRRGSRTNVDRGAPSPLCLILKTWELAKIPRKIRFSKSLGIKIREAKDLERDDLRYS